MSQLVGLTNASSSGALLSKFGHESDPTQMLLRDAAGNLKRQVAAFATNAAYSGMTNYNYDNKSQLLSESSTRIAGFNNGFGYDAAGNPTSWKGQTRTFNALNQETTGGTSQFAFDGNGNATTYKGSNLTFNESDKLTRIAVGSTVSFQAGYRSDGLRAWKKVGSGTTYFLYDGSQLVCEFDDSVKLKASILWGANGVLGRQVNVTGPRQQQPSMGLTSLFLYDDRGNIAQVLNTSGSVVSNFSVSGWGEVKRDQSVNDPYFGLGGQFGNYFDIEIGLTLCGQRYYDPAGGRWLTRDPIEYSGGMNLYGYVGNNPVNYVDPDGLARVELRWRKVMGPTNHAFLLLWDTDSKGNKVGAPRYFAGYKGDGMGSGSDLRVRYGFYTGGKNGSPDWEYQPKQKLQDDLRGSVLIVNDCKPASSYIKRFKAVAAKVNAAGLDYPTLGYGINSNTVARQYIESGLGISLLKKLSPGQTLAMPGINAFFLGLDRSFRSYDY